MLNEDLVQITKEKRCVVRKTPELTVVTQPVKLIKTENEETPKSGKKIRAKKAMQTRNRSKLVSDGSRLNIELH